jgi:hypothetical protein
MVKPPWHVLVSLQARLMIGRRRIRFQRKPMAWLKPYEKNARQQGKAQIEQIRSSLKQFGWTVPVTRARGRHQLSKSGPSCVSATPPLKRE